MTICLVSMVRNEEPRIGRMIASVVGFVDHAVILDTGSTDRTIDTARRVLTAHSIEHEIHSREWVDFGTGRTQLYDLARDHDWQFLLDGDMTATVSPYVANWLRSEAKADAFMVQLRQPGLEWRLPMLTRGHQDWRYVGAIHEGLDRTGRDVQELFADNISIWHHGDNGRAGKLEERLALLETKPDDPHSVYYAAQTLRDLGRTVEAIEAYRQCAGMPEADPDHRWHARYQAAALAGDVAELVACADDQDSRAEPLRAAARILEARADSLIMPTGLFVEPDAYRR